MLKKEARTFYFLFFGFLVNVTTLVQQIFYFIQYIKTPSSGDEKFVL
jgi:hypothetical protein